MMNLPLANLNRNELYTFIVGLFMGLTWHLYFQEIGYIASQTRLIDSTLIFAWLFSTGLVYIIYMILSSVMEAICKQKIKGQNDEEEMNKMKLVKNLLFFWAGSLEERKLLLHIFGLLTVSLT